MEGQNTHLLTGRQRSSLACVQCRNRHSRCDGAAPVCSRCLGLNIQCVYLKSRRGGRREKNHEVISDLTSTNETTANAFSSSLLMGSDPGPSPSPQRILLPDDSLTTAIIADGPHSSGSSGAPSSVSSFVEDQRYNIIEAAETRNSLLELYYTCFHQAHPCVLPRKYFEDLLDEPEPGVAFLMQVMIFVGSLFCPKLPSAPFEEQIKMAIASGQQRDSPFVVQALVLYAIAVYWCDDRLRSRELLDVAIKMAVRLQMNKREFAPTNSNGNQVLAESFRRTWWLLYVTGAHIAAIDHASTFSVSQRNLSCTVDLPCEEDDYSSGVCKIAHFALQDY
jgi:Zn(2)-Cys(6) binuclear cluster domain-containing protein/transcription factor-like protein